MKILKLRFKNLNSLSGEWEIDFTHPDCQGAGIFAITGRTGAGKSTLLDAICLGLYGRTPRLPSIGKSGNEILSKGQVECFSEVTFEARGVHWRCSWRQNRARKKQDGELQPPQMELVQVGTNLLITGLKKVEEGLIAATGLQWEQFTRSVLLAQGGFAAFLQATPDSRAPLLEEITGTEIYTQLSQMVHERYGEERTQGAALEAKMAAKKLLSPEEAAQLHAEIQKFEASSLAVAMEKASVESQWAACQDALAWEKEWGAHLAEWEAWQAQGPKRAAWKEQLDLAERAESLGPFERETQERKREWEGVLDRGRLAEQQLDQAIKESQRVLAMESEAKQALEADKVQFELVKPVLLEAQKCDVQIQETKAECQRLALVERSHENNTEACLCEAENWEAKKQAAQAELQNVKFALQERPFAAQILPSKEMYFSLFQTAFHHASELESQERALSEAENAEKECIKRQEEADAKYLEVTERHEILTQKKKSQEEALLSHWGHEGESGLQAERVRLLEQLHRWEGLQEWMEKIQKLTERQREAEAQKNAAEAQLQAAVVARETQEGLLGACRRECRALEGQRELLEDLQRLSHLREKLVEGEACPLCGSLHHPRAGEQPQGQSLRLEHQLDAARASLEHAEFRWQQLQHEESLADAQVHLAESASLHWGQEWVQAQNAFAERWGEGACPGPETCHQGLHQTQAELQAVAEAIQKGRNALQVLSALQDEWEALGAAKQEALNAALALRHEGMGAHKRTFELQKERNAREAQLQDAREALLSGLAGWPERPSLEGASGSVKACQMAFENLLCQYESLIKKQESLSKDIEISGLAIDEKRKESERLQGVWRSAHAETLAREAALAQLQQQRARLMVEDDPIAALKRREKALETLQSAHEQMRLLAVEAERDSLRLQTERAHWKDKQGPLAQEAYQMALQRWEDTARGLGFATPQEALLARRGAEEMRALRQGWEAFEQQNHSLNARRQSLEQQKSRWDTPPVGGWDLEALAFKRQELLKTQEGLWESMGGLKQVLLANEESEKSNAELRVQAEKQKAEVSRWELLHDVMGSADGKKFRNFAQGLTFERVVQNANHKLVKMTDRYELIRDAQQPLELVVKDNWQGGEIRSTRNLSGGESFLMSLALALGLAEMASSRVSVDSLFLDEGFGTLDEESLEVALDALSSLHREGKMVGVISHVAQLKERIPTQIRVVSQSQGRSTLEGPGCRRVLGR